MPAKFNLTAQLQLQSPTNVNQVVSQIKKQLKPVGVDVQISNVKNIAKANKDMQSLSNSAKASSRQMSDFNRTLQESARRFSVITLATGTLLGFANSLKNSVREAVAFERELVKISQVTGDSVRELSSLSDEVTRLATSLGASSADLLNVSRILSQAGFNAKETREALDILAKTSLGATFDSIQDTTEGAIAILRQFGAEAQRSGGEIKFLEQSLDAINSVSKNFAVESGDLISAIRRTGGVFAAAGGEVNELIALFTSVRATTRESAETIATGLRTIFTRIQRVETVEQLKALGIQLQDSRGQFVGAFEAFKRLSEGLTALDPRDFRFSQIVEQLGGFRQIGKVIPLVQQFTTAQEALLVAQQSTGSVTEDAITAQQSLGVQFDRVREKFDALIRRFADTSTFRSLAGGVLQLAEAFIKIAEALEPVLPLLTALAFAKIGKGIAPAIASFAGIGRRIGPGGPISKFNTGGMVPGAGNRDTVPAMLTPGEFVIRKSSVESIGAHNLAALNAGGSVQAFADGGQVQKFQRGKKVQRKIVAPSTDTQSSHISEVLDLTPDEMKRAIMGLAGLAGGRGNDKFKRSFIKNFIGQEVVEGQRNKSLAPSSELGKLFNQRIQEVVNDPRLIKQAYDQLGMKTQNSIKVNLPASFNQALRVSDPDLVDKIGLVNWVSTRKDNLFDIGSRGSALNRRFSQRSPETQQLQSVLANRIFRTPTKPQNDEKGIFDQVRKTFDTDYELDSLGKAVVFEMEKIDERVARKLLSDVDFQFKGSGAFARRKRRFATERTSKTGFTKDRSNAAFAQPEQFAAGGMVQPQRQLYGSATTPLSKGEFEEYKQLSRLKFKKGARAFSDEQKATFKLLEARKRQAGVVEGARASDKKSAEGRRTVSLKSDAVGGLFLKEGSDGSTSFSILPGDKITKRGSFQDVGTIKANIGRHLLRPKSSQRFEQSLKPAVINSIDSLSESVASDLSLPSLPQVDAEAVSRTVLNKIDLDSLSGHFFEGVTSNLSGAPLTESKATFDFVKPSNQARGRLQSLFGDKVGEKFLEAKNTLSKSSIDDIKGKIITGINAGQLERKDFQGFQRGGDVKKRTGRAYVFDFDDTLATTEAKSFKDFGDPSLIESAQATRYASLAKRRASQGDDIHVLTARLANKEISSAINKFMSQIGAPARSVIGVAAGEVDIPSGEKVSFEGLREPGKRAGTTRKIGTAGKKALVLSKLAKIYDEITFLDDSVENVVKAAESASNVRAVQVDKSKAVRKYSGGEIQKFARAGKVQTLRQRLDERGLSDEVFDPITTTRGRAGEGDPGRRQQILSQRIEFLQRRQVSGKITPDEEIELASLLARRQQKKLSRGRRFSDAMFSGRMSEILEKQEAAKEKRGLQFKNLGGRISPASADAPAVKRFATGGPATDTVPALLTPGEFVVNRKSAQKIGYNNLHQMNRSGVQHFQEGGTVQKKRAKKTNRVVGFIDSDVLADPKNAEVVRPEMEKLELKKVAAYHDYLTKEAIRLRKADKVSRLTTIVALPGAGKSALIQGGQSRERSDNASLRQTKRIPILTIGDFKRVSQVIDTSASVSQEKLSNFQSSDRVFELSTSTKEEQEELERRRKIRDVTGVNLFGRKPGTTTGAAVDSGPLEAELAASLPDSKLAVLGIRKDAALKLKKGEERVAVSKEVVNLVQGAFAPFTRGHESVINEAAKGYGVDPGSFIILVGSSESVKAGDPHTYRTAIFDQDFRAVMARAAVAEKGARVAKKAGRDFSIPRVFETTSEETANRQRRFVVAKEGSRAFVGKEGKNLPKYEKAGYRPTEIDRNASGEGISGTQVREAVMSGNTGALKNLLSPPVFKVVEQNITNLKNRAEVIPRIIESLERKNVPKLEQINAALAEFPKRIDRKRAASDPEYAAIAEKVDELRKRRDKIKGLSGSRPFAILKRLSQAFPDKYGLRGVQKLNVGGQVDNVPALLTPGEFVVKKNSAQSIGYSNLNRMNEQGARAFRDGGPIQKFATGGTVQKFQNGTGPLGVTGGGSVGFLDTDTAQQKILKLSDALDKMGLSVDDQNPILQKFYDNLAQGDSNASALAKAFEQTEVNVKKMGDEADAFRASGAANLGTAQGSSPSESRLQASPENFIPQNFGRFLNEQLVQSSSTVIPSDVKNDALELAEKAYIAALDKGKSQKEAIAIGEKVFGERLRSASAGYDKQREEIRKAIQSQGLLNKSRAALSASYNKVKSVVENSAKNLRSGLASIRQDPKGAAKAAGGAIRTGVRATASFGRDTAGGLEGIAGAAQNFVFLGGSVAALASSFSGLSDETQKAIQETAGFAAGIVGIGGTVTQVLTGLVNATASSTASEITETQSNVVGAASEDAETQANLRSASAGQKFAGALGGIAIGVTVAVTALKYFSAQNRAIADSAAKDFDTAFKAIQETGVNNSAQLKQAAAIEIESRARSTKQFDSSSIATAAGFAAAGAAIGSFIPGLGTAVGALIGGLVGAGVGVAKALSDVESELNEEAAARQRQIDKLNQSIDVLASFSATVVKASQQFQDIESTEGLSVERRQEERRATTDLILDEKPLTKLLGAQIEARAIAGGTGLSVEQLSAKTDEERFAIFEEFSKDASEASAKLAQFRVATATAAQAQSAIQAAYEQSSKTFSTALQNADPTKTFDQLIAEGGAFAKAFEQRRKAIATRNIERRRTAEQAVSTAKTQQELTGEESGLAAAQDNLNKILEQNAKSMGLFQEGAETAIAKRNEENARIQEAIKARIELAAHLKRQTDALAAANRALVGLEEKAREIDFDAAVARGETPKLEFKAPDLNVDLPVDDLRNNLQKFVNSIQGLPEELRDSGLEAANALLQSRNVIEKSTDSLLKLGEADFTEGATAEVVLEKIGLSGDLVKKLLGGGDEAFREFNKQLTQAASNSEITQEEIDKIFGPIIKASEVNAQRITAIANAANQQLQNAQAITAAEKEARNRNIEALEFYSSAAAKSAEVIAEATGRSTAVVQAQNERRTAQSRLTAGTESRGGVALQAGNLTQLKLAKARAKADVDALRIKIKEIQATGKGVENLAALAVQLDQAQQVIKDTNAEFERMSQSTAQIAVVQERLAKAEASRSQQAALVEEFVVGGDEQRKSLNEAAQGIRQALATGTLQNQTEEQRSATVGLLDKLSDVVLPGTFGLTGEEVKQELVFRDAISLGLDPTVAKAIATQTSEQKQLIIELRNLTKVTQEAARARALSSGGLVYRADGGTVPAASGFAAGGTIFKPKGTDTVPAMLTPGEFVIRKSAVKKVGTDALHAINNGVSYHQAGGIVGQNRGQGEIRPQQQNAVNAFNAEFQDQVNIIGRDKLFGVFETAIYNVLGTKGFLALLRNSKATKANFGALTTPERKTLVQSLNNKTLPIRKMKSFQQLESMVGIIEDNQDIFISAGAGGFRLRPPNFASLQDVQETRKKYAAITSVLQSKVNAPTATFGQELLGKAGIDFGGQFRALNESLVSAGAALDKFVAKGATEQERQQAVRDFAGARSADFVSDSKQGRIKSLEEKRKKTGLTSREERELRRLKAEGSGVALAAEAVIAKLQLNKGGKVPYLASGGGVDKVPAMLTPGEYVMSADTVRNHGVNFMENLNKGRVPGFNKGGLVGGGVQYRQEGGILSALGGAAATLGIDTSGIQGAFDGFVANFSSALDNIVAPLSNVVTAMKQMFESFGGFTFQHTVDVTGVLNVGGLNLNAVKNELSQTIGQMVADEVKRMMDEKGKNFKSN